MIAERDDTAPANGTAPQQSAEARRAAMAARYPAAPSYTPASVASTIPDAPGAYPATTALPAYAATVAAPGAAMHDAVPPPSAHAYPPASSSMYPPVSSAAVPVPVPAASAAYPAAAGVAGPPAVMPPPAAPAVPVAAVTAPPAAVGNEAAGPAPPMAPPSVVAPPARPAPTAITPAPVTSTTPAAAQPSVVPAGAYPTSLAPAAAGAPAAAAATAAAAAAAAPEAVSGSFPKQPTLVDQALSRRASVGRRGPALLGGLGEYGARAAATEEAKTNAATRDAGDDVRSFSANVGAILFGTKVKDDDDTELAAAHRAESARIRTAATDAFNAGEAVRMLGPPTWQEDGGGYFGAYEGLRCFMCRTTFGLARRKHHCRNCGHLVCSKCSAPRWPKTMLPKSFKKGGGRQRVCDTCHTAFEAFRQALLDGNFARLREVFMTGYIRDVSCPYSVYPGNQYPVHCAAIGGSVDAMRWLLSECRAPLNSLDSKRHGPLYHAAKHQHVALMRYLVLDQKCLLTDITDRAVLHDALYAALLGHRPDGAPLAEPRYVTVLADTVGVARMSGEYRAVVPDNGKGDDDGSNGGPAGSQPSPSAPPEVVDARKLEAAEEVAVRARRTGSMPGGRGAGGGMSGAGAGAGSDAAVAAVVAQEVPPGEAEGSDAPDDCVVCMERPINSVLVPCGHCCMCTQCARSSNFRHCPVCRAEVAQVVKTFRVGAF